MKRGFLAKKGCPREAYFLAN
uniref:Uncharacterized protein n=1 Tax=Arundo donax TaxID=35708 RepID=A0A0A8ZKV9_ARUDO